MISVFQLRKLAKVFTPEQQARLKAALAACGIAYVLRYVAHSHAGRGVYKIYVSKKDLSRAKSVIGSASIQ